MDHQNSYLSDTVLNYTSRIEFFKNWAIGSGANNAEYIRSKFIKTAKTQISSDLIIL
jgi:hypothetical protein